LERLLAAPYSSTVLGGHIAPHSAHPLVRILSSNDTSAVIGASHPGPAFRRSIFGASNLSGILGCFDRARQSRRLFNMFGGIVRLVVGLRQLWLRFLKPFFDCRLPRHFGWLLRGPSRFQPRSSELVAALASDIGTKITTKVPLNGLESRRRSLSRYLLR
jgi:hypothetical protein